MKTSLPAFKAIARGLAFVCVPALAFSFYRWRHPALPETTRLPPGARLVYSLRYLNPLMTGPALYYRIGSPLSQRDTAIYINGTGEGIRRFSGLAASRNGFKDTSLEGSVNDPVLVFDAAEQNFSTESDGRGEYRFWKTGKGSTAEILVWTKF